MVDFRLPEATAAIRSTAREFVHDVVLPADLQAREQIPDPIERFPWDLVEAGSTRGLRELTVPEAYGGPAASTLSLVVAAEELGYGDPGIATTFTQCWRIARMIEALGTPEQRDRFFEAFTANERYLTAVALTEPAHGSNNTITYDGNNLDTVARRDGDRWVISGEKRYITNAPVSELLIVFANTNPDGTRTDGVSRFMVPSDAPGLSIKTKHDKLGERLKTNTSLTFDEVAVPAENLLGERDTAFSSEHDLSAGRLYYAARFLGLSKAAYHAAREHAQSRQQGGRRIIEHQSIQTELAEMAIGIETARSTIYRAGWAVDTDAPHAAELIDMSKVYMAEVAKAVCQSALSILGGRGVMRDESLVEKYVRDSLHMDHVGGTQQVLKHRLGTVTDPGFVE